MKLALCSSLLFFCVTAPGGPAPGTMIVLDLSGDGIVMTRPGDGVRFDLDADGHKEQISWTGRQVDDAILVVDVNGNGSIDSGTEVVGRYLRLPGPWRSSTGADALIYELQGLQPGQQPRPAGSAEINNEDPTFERLRLWSDRDHDGQSATHELSTLPSSAVTLIRTGFLRPRPGSARSTDSIGNGRLFEGTFLLRQRGVDFPRLLVEYEPIR